jgi:hypothetical protein
VIRGLRVPVNLTSREALRMFDVADIWATRTGHAVRLVSANDHVHSRGSAHYAGMALDLHSSDPDALSAALQRAGYLVLWNVPGHYGHVHVEHERSGGLTHRLDSGRQTRRHASVSRQGASASHRVGERAEQTGG